ncbi:MAG: hypothetical protein ISR82_04430 [Candidatus Marinimicrobia bacterium]|nr:hypothetical protein [Candidatus Neomarinimicrobiota bacterium]MBL7010448.1 hypothetical protein [Candidatus Neomarinimicrobiota bacterium]MBL7030056.1 hypothetical protein [Candidatus Neomarinimicrobiota bacterium]
MKKIILIACFGFMVSIGNAQMKKGIGPMLGTRGYGIIFSGQWQIKPNIITGFETRFYDIKNDSELPGYNRFTGQTLNVGDKALFMLPIFGTIKWLPFEGKIANNFSPFTSIKLGPILAVDGKEDSRKFSERWGKAGTIVTYGVQVAFGVSFLQMGGSTISPSIGFEYLPMGQEVDGRNNYNGTVVNITFTFGNSRR